MRRPWTPAAIALALLLASFAVAGLGGIPLPTAWTQAAAALAGALALAGLLILFARLYRKRLPSSKRQPVALSAIVTGLSFILLFSGRFPTLDELLAVGGFGGLVLGLMWPVRATRILSVSGILFLFIGGMAARALTTALGLDAPEGAAAPLALAAVNLASSAFYVAAYALALKAELRADEA